MNTDCWVLVTAEGWSGALAAARTLPGRVSAIVIGARELAEQVARAGPDDVRWFEPGPVPAEACATALADLAAGAPPGLLVATLDPAGRVLLGAVAGRLGARLLPGVVGLAIDGDRVLVRRSAVGGETIETLACSVPVAVLYTGEDAAAPPAEPAPITRLALRTSPVTVIAHEPLAVARGLQDADRVVAFGRGVRNRDDVALVRELADALDAELACSMPIADDFGWLEASRYVGRSGNHITPDLYLAVGIGGAPQHMEGVRGARLIAAVNNDPQARVFRTCDYGIVGDLYEVVPELTRAVRNLTPKELEQ